MSFVLQWIQDASRLLKEARDLNAARSSHQAFLSERWHVEVNKLLKPAEPRGGMSD